MVIQRNKSDWDISQSCLGAKRNTYPRDIGIKEINIYGWRLPYEVFVLSDIVPIKGSVKASTHRAINIAVPAKPGLRPIILL